MLPNFNKRLLVPVITLLAVVGLAVISVIYTNTNSQQTPAPTTNQPTTSTPTETPTDSSTPATESSREDISPFLENLNILSEVFTDIEYFFINQSAMQFANKEFSDVSRFAIDPVSFGQRSDGNYSFSVIDGANNTRLFYVIIFRNADGGITVEQYL